jgi:hypothetical protein
MGEHDERRGSRRLTIELPVECTPLDSDATAPRRGVTRNLASGGLYFETDAEDMQSGSVWTLALTVPPGEGHFPYAGQVYAVGEVVRVDKAAGSPTEPRRRGVAVCYREPLQLRFQDQ